MRTRVPTVLVFCRPQANVPHLLVQNLALDYKDPLEIALMTKQEREEGYCGCNREVGVAGRWV